MQNKRNRHGRQGHNVTGEPLDSIHLGEGERIRLDEIPIEDTNGDHQVGNRIYNDARYQFKGQAVNNQTAFLSGGFWVYTGVGLIFQTVRTVFIMAGYDNPFVVESTVINLEDFPELDNDTLPQYVRPVFDINGNAFPLFGIASVNPGVPSVPDPLTQIAGDEFLLNAGATEVDPGEGEGQVQTVILFAEGSVGEATWVHTGSGSTNFANAAAPIAGLIDAKVSAVQNNSRQIGTRPVNFNPQDFETISMDLKLDAVMATGYNLAVQFWDASDVAVSSLVNLAINKGSTAVQKVGLAIADFTFTGTIARKVILQWRRGSGSVTYPGFQFDNFILQGGLATPIVQGDVVLSGDVTASGKTGTPIPVTANPALIGGKTAAGTLLGDEEILLRIPGTNVLRKTTLSSAVGIGNGNTGRRLVSSQILIDSPTAGRINAQWYSATNLLRTLTNAALTFAGATSAGNVRWDLVELYDDGTAAVKTGTVGATAVRPTPTANTLIGGEFIWDENGIATPVETIGSFSNDLYTTLIAANTTGKYAKIWEGDLSVNNNYGIEIVYHEPTSIIGDGTGLGNVKVSWTCNPDKSINTDSVRFITYPGSMDGEFRLVQLAGNKAALYHRSNHYWGRIQFRILFQNSAVRIQDFIDLAPYGSTPTGVGFWDSVVLEAGGGGGGGLELVAFSSVINFAGNFKSYHLQTAAIAYTGPTVDALVNFANTTEHYIRANNTGGKPTFNSQFIKMLDNWNNGVDKWNFIKFKMLPSGKIGYWIYDVSE